MFIRIFAIVALLMVGSVHAGSSSAISSRSLVSNAGLMPTTGRRYSRRSSSAGYGLPSSHHANVLQDDDAPHLKEVQQCSSSGLVKNLFRGAFLRIASDLSGGTPLETLKCRVTVTNENMFQAYHEVVKADGIGGLWSGTPSRTVEGALLGALFMLGSALTKKQVLAMGGSKTMAALAAGTVGGVAQAVVMTPAGMIFTSLNVNRGKPGYENDTAITVAKRIIDEKGIMGLFYGGGPMCMRQASNWASRSCFTEIARTTFKMSNYGLLGEIGSGAIGGVGSCWNTPIETIRVLMQRDVSLGKPTKTFGGYWNAVCEEQGFQGLFRGVTPRAIQAIWQTIFMVVVPNVMGI